MNLPAAEYNRRVFAVTVALLVYNVASMLGVPFTAGGIEGNLSQVYLYGPLLTAIFTTFGTLDSAEAGRRIIRIIRIWCCLKPHLPHCIPPAAGRIGEALLHGRPIFN